MRTAVLLVLELCFVTPLLAATTAEAVLNHYADIAHAKYADSLTTARELAKAVDQLLAKPSEAYMKAAQSAWKAARVPYQQTEVYRFGNAIVDDWEGRVTPGRWTKD